MKKAIQFAFCFLPLLPLSAWGEADAENGKELYERMCSGCHGIHGKGGEGYRGGFTPHPRNLADKEYMQALPDEYLFLVIQKGGAYVGKNSLMPGWEKSLTEEEIKDIVAHIRRLR